MSHVATATIVISNLIDCKAAVKRLGGTLNEGMRKFKNYQGKGKCDMMISFPGASYEAGLVKQKDGTYRLLYDSWGSGGLAPILGGHNAGRFADAYGIEAAKRMATLKGYFPREIKRKDGQLELEVLVR